MKSYELFAAMPSALAIDILEFAFAADKPLYRTTMEAVAQARKLRPVFLERQPRAERNTAIAAALGRPALDLAADSLLRSWLLKKHSAVLADFLDALKIPHDKGVVENLPPSVEDAALQAAIESLLTRHSSEIAAIYLHAFISMNEVNWPNLDALVQADARLKLSQPTPP